MNGIVFIVVAAAFACTVSAGENVPPAPGTVDELMRPKKGAGDAPKRPPFTPEKLRREKRNRRRGGPPKRDPKRRLDPKDRPKPEEVEMMESWWCDQHKESHACVRKGFHALSLDDRKVAAKKLRESFRGDKKAMMADRKDVDDMHRAWCKHEGDIGGIDHSTCKAWMFSRGISKDEL